jgi:NADPH2:quinone reductase
MEVEMKKVQFSEFGGPERLSVVTASSAPVGEGQVRVQVAAIGMNFAEIVQLSGEFQIPTDLPAVPGFEFAGTVAELGPGVTGLSVGDRVITLVCWGAYADEVVVDASTVVAIPADLGFETAAAFPVSFATAFMSLHHRARVRPGETVLVAGARGNVGYAAVQVARRLGAGQVVAVTRNGTETVPQADAVLASTEKLPSELADLTGGRGADVILDLVGGDVFPRLLDTAAWEGRLVTAGYASGGIPDLHLLDVLIRNVAVLGEDIAAYTVRDPQAVAGALRTLVQWYRQGTLEPRPPTATLPLASAAEALAKVADGTAGGKLVLTTD